MLYSKTEEHLKVSGFSILKRQVKQRKETFVLVNLSGTDFVKEIAKFGV